MVPDIRLLQYFVVLASELHFGRAAERLFISQPALSRQIRELEKSLGVELFTRTKRVVRLTEAGQVLLAESRRAINELEQIVIAVQRAGGGESGHLRVGSYSSVANYILPEIVAEFRRQSPGVELTLHEDLHRSELIESLLNRALDIAFVRPPLGQQNLSSDVLVKEPEAVVLPESHPLAQAEQASLADLADADFIMWPRPFNTEGYDRMIAACRNCGFSPRIVQEASTNIAIIGLVAAGVGVGLSAFSNRHLQRRGVRFVPLKELESVTMIAWNEVASKPTTRKFVELAQRLAPTLIR